MRNKKYIAQCSQYKFKFAQPQHFSPLYGHACSVKSNLFLHFADKLKREAVPSQRTSAAGS